MKYLLLLAIVLTPFISSAATFYYVNTLGMTDSVEAPDAETALVLASDRKADSGVTLDEGYIEPGMLVPAAVADSVDILALTNLQSETTFHFVNKLGLTDSVEAPNADTALVIAPNIASNSGVAIDQGDIEEGMRVLSAE
jgi:hypothetical protein